jgi:hypothetical protein
MRGISVARQAIVRFREGMNLDLSNIIGQLRNELDALNVSILALERVECGKVRLGRPPRWVATAKDALLSKPHKASRSNPRKASRSVRRPAR